MGAKCVDKMSDNSYSGILLIHFLPFSEKMSHKLVNVPGSVLTSAFRISAEVVEPYFLTSSKNVELVQKMSTKSQKVA